MIQLQTKIPNFHILEVPGLGNKVLALCFDTRREMTESFFRLQEFYESPFPEIKGQMFSLEQWEKLYTSEDYQKQIDGESYFDYWEGFNIPASAAKQFLNHQRREIATLSAFEQWLSEQLNIGFDTQYVIAFDLTSSANTYPHELCHAWFALHKPFHIEAFDRMLKAFDQLGLRKSQLLLEGLTNSGYPHDLRVLCDELAAYILTGDEQELTELWPALDWKYEIEPLQQEYRRNFDRIVDIEWAGVGN